MAAAVSMFEQGFYRKALCHLLPLSLSLSVSMAFVKSLIDCKTGAKCSSTGEVSDVFLFSFLFFVGQSMSTLATEPLGVNLMF